MSFLENIGFGSSLKEAEKITSEKESKELILEYIEDYKDIVDFRNHRVYSLGSRKNVYRFTLRLVSLDFLSKMAKDKRVRNVFFSPSTPPPGGGVDGISMRYKIYVEYH